jgi:hypothetical protein
MNSRTLWNLLMKRQIKSSTLPPSGLSQSSLLTMWRNLLLISGKNTEESAEKKSQERSLPQPMPCIFNETENEYEIKYVHPLPVNQILKVDNAGMGLVLMHKSVLTALNEKFPGDFWFGENGERREKFIGEDIAFFRKVRKSGMSIHAHTGVIAKHMKRFAFDGPFYNLYWTAVEATERKERESTKK